MTASFDVKYSFVLLLSALSATAFCRRSWECIGLLYLYPTANTLYRGLPEVAGPVFPAQPNQGQVEPSRAHKHAHACTHTHVYIHAHTHTHTHTRVYTHTRTHAHTHARTHARAHTRKRARTHTHTHTAVALTIVNRISHGRPSALVRVPPFPPAPPEIHIPRAVQLTRRSNPIC